MRAQSFVRFHPKVGIPFAIELEIKVTRLGRWVNALRSAGLNVTGFEADRHWFGAFLRDYQYTLALGLVAVASMAAVGFGLFNRSPGYVLAALALSAGLFMLLDYWMWGRSRRPWYYRI